MEAVEMDSATKSQGGRRAGRGGGRAARRAARSGDGGAARDPFVVRRFRPFEIFDEDALATIEANADTVLQEVGIEFRDDEEALQIWRAAGADVDGVRVRFPRGMCRKLVQDTAPAEFVQHARNPANNVRIGGDATVFAPAYGPPFIRNLDEGRRYATIEDFRNFVKLAYMSPALHHSGGTLCEPVDLPVNKRHLDMVASHILYSDKAFMGSVTVPGRAQDTVDMAKIVFGNDFVETNCCVISLINANSPMNFDDTMLGAGRRHEPGDGCRHPDPDPCRGDDRHGVRATGAAGCAGGIRHLRQFDFDAVRCADLRNA
jgi:trimethylamine--corrinoid protein Co-methyltransferase